MKKEIYVCTVCGGGITCLREAGENEICPDSCTHSDNDNSQNWQKTTAYEITKIMDKVTQYVLDGIEKDFQKPHLEGINIPAPPDPPPKRKICEDILTPGPAAKKAMEKIHIFESKKDMEEFIERRVAPNLTTPNCAICRWKDQEKYKTEYSCGGQGMRKLTSVYGNKICKRLFEPADTIAGPDKEEKICVDCKEPFTGHFCFRCSI